MAGFNVILLADTPEHPFWYRGYGAHRLANHLRHNGYSCLVVDFTSAMSFDTWKDICNLAVGDDTKVIGLSTTWWPYRNQLKQLKVSLVNNLNLKEKKTIEQHGLLDAALEGTLLDWFNVAKTINPKIKFLLGGPKFEFYLDAPVDNFVAGFGETQFIDYLQYPNRLWPKIINHDETASAPTWDFKESQTLYTDLDQISSNEILTFEFSRGCRFKCAFCSYPLIGKKDISSYIKSKDSIYTELLTNYERWGTTQYVVADDTLNDSTEKLEHILSAVKNLPFKPKFKAYTRLDVIATHPEQAILLKEIGLANTWIGIDSFHPKASKVIGKGMPAERRKDMLYTLKDIWGESVTITAGYIVGLPFEDKDSLYESAKWLAQPGSPVYSTTFMGLRLNPPNPRLNFTPRSDMDLKYKDYGYDIPDINKFWEWTKNDQTGINTYMDSEIVARQLNSMIPDRLTLPNMHHDSIVLDNPNNWYFKQLVNQLKTTI